MIEVAGVSKRFGNVRALESVSFSLSEPGLYALVGPNGSGKSTLLRVMAGVLQPDEGRVSLSPETAVIGYMPQDIAVYPDLTVVQNIRFFLSLNGKDAVSGSRIESLLYGLGLYDKRDVLASELSGGMSRALSFACTIITRPDILFLDEPTAGMDYRIEHHFWKELAAVSDSGSIILFSSHSPSAVSHSHRVIVMKEGKISGIKPGRNVSGLEEIIEDVQEQTGVEG